MIGKGFAKQVDRLITYNAKVTKLMQDKKGVSVTYTDLVKGGTVTAEAEFCVCTIPADGAEPDRDQPVGEEDCRDPGGAPTPTRSRSALEMRRRFLGRRPGTSTVATRSPTRRSAWVSYPNFDFFKGRPGGPCWAPSPAGLAAITWAA
jgi:monoamine oxidase